MSETFKIRPATPDDAAVILELIRELADFEKLLHEVDGSEEKIRATLFGAKPAAEVLIAELIDTSAGVGPGSMSAGSSAKPKAAGYALFFTNYSTFRTAPGIYLEDLYVRPQFRSHGIGKKMLACLAKIAVERGCARLDWSVLDWNNKAWDFYASLGAIPMKGWTTHRLTGDALVGLAGDFPEKADKKK
jgi:GNAT superfamily N-acetyltransferase